MELGELRLVLLPVAVERDIAEGVVVECVFGLELREKRTGERGGGERWRAGGKRLHGREGEERVRGEEGGGGARRLPRRLDWRG